VLLVWDYCIARRLDPLKKPVHIVPIEVKDAKTGKYEWRDVVLPGIYELRTTAQRTGVYLGHSKPVYGPPISAYGVEAPEWVELTVYRYNAASSQRVEFPVCVFFREVVALTKEKRANSRWAKAPIQMLTKCAEAAALREAFPDEIGGEHTVDEMDGQRAIDAPVVTEEKPVLPKPEGFDEWFVDMQAVADEGVHLLAEAWRNSPAETRAYLTATDPSAWEGLKVRAAQADATRTASVE
jgi:phage recombination protein Bet